MQESRRYPQLASPNSGTGAMAVASDVPVRRSCLRLGELEWIRPARRSTLSTTPMPRRTVNGLHCLYPNGVRLGPIISMLHNGLAAIVVHQMLSTQQFLETKVRTTRHSISHFSMLELVR
jgi:hypothetical protein